MRLLTEEDNQGRLQMKALMHWEALMHSEFLRGETPAESLIAYCEVGRP